MFFIGECEFKTHVPENVLNKGLANYIEGFSGICFQEHQVRDIENRLRNVKENGGISKSDHLNSLKERHSFPSRSSYQSSQPSQDESKCPRGGGRLIDRVAKKGTNAGRKFKGCSGYPKCHYILNS